MESRLARDKVEICGCDVSLQALAEDALQILHERGRWSDPEKGCTRLATPMAITDGAKTGCFTGLWSVG